MLSDGVSFLQDGYWWLIYPVGICIVLTVMAFNFIGDALRDSVDVRLSAGGRESAPTRDREVTAP